MSALFAEITQSSGISEIHHFKEGMTDNPLKYKLDNSINICINIYGTIYQNKKGADRASYTISYRRKKNLYFNSVYFDNVKSNIPFTAKTRLLV